MENIITTENIDNSVVPTNIEAPQEVVVESSNIVDPPSKKLWEGLSKKKLYTKSFQEFEKNFSSPDKINKLWGGLSEKKLYTKSESDFQQQYFPKAPEKKYVKSDPTTEFGLGLAELGKPLFVPQQLGPIVPVKIVPEEKKKEKESSGLGLYTIPGLVQDIRESGLNNVIGYAYNKILSGIGKAITAPADFIFNALTSSETLRGGGTKEEVLKEYRNNVLPLVSKTIKDNLGANVSLEKENKYNEGFVTGTIGGLAETLPAILTPAPARAAVLFSQGFESQLESINNTDVGKNLPESTKTVFATGTGTAMAALERFGIEKILGNTSNKVAQSLSIKTINELIEKAPKEITSEMFEKALNSQIVSLKDQIVEKGGKIASAALVEGITGGLQEITAITGEKITNLSTNKKVFDYESFGVSAGRVLKSAGQEALGGVALGSVVSNMNKIDNYVSDKVSNAKSIEDINKIKSDLILEVNNGSISDVDAEKINGLIDEYSNIYSTIPEFSENRKKIASKIKERTGIISDIESKVETLKKVDEAFQPQMMAEIEALKGRAVEINEEINNIARNKEEVVAEEVTVVEPTIEKVVDKSIIPQEVKTVEQLRAEEQQEYNAIDPNDEVKRKEIYDKYDKLITPLLQEGTIVSEKPIETKPIEMVEPVVISTKEEQGISYKPEQEVVIKEVETKLGGKKKAEELFKVEARHTYGETYEDFILRKGCQ
jgi:hypothetical protein